MAIYDPYYLGKTLYSFKLVTRHSATNYKSRRWDLELKPYLVWAIFKIAYFIFRPIFFFYWSPSWVRALHVIIFSFEVFLIWVQFFEQRGVFQAEDICQQPRLSNRYINNNSNNFIFRIKIQKLDSLPAYSWKANRGGARQVHE